MLLVPLIPYIFFQTVFSPTSLKLRALTQLLQTTHMCEFKDELAEQGLDLMDFSTVSSEFLQKILRQQFARASNFHYDAPIQVACTQTALSHVLYRPLLL